MRKKLLISTITGVIVIAALTAVVLNSSKFTGKFPRNTIVANIDISKKTLAEAKVIIDKPIKEFLNKEIELSILGKTKKVKIRDLGVQILGSQTLDVIKQTDKEDNNKFIVSLDREKMENTLDKIFEFRKLEPKSATFFFDPKGNLAIKEGEDGIVIDTETLVKELRAAAQNLQLKKITVATENQKPAITKEILEGEQEKIKQSLDHKFVLIDPVYTDDWELKLRDRLDWVKFTQKEEITLPVFNQKILIDPSSKIAGKNLITIEIDQNKLDAFVDEKISKWLDKPAEPVKIYTDENEKVVIEGKGNNGKMIQRKKLKQAIEIAVEQRIKDVTIPVVDIEPAIEISEDLQAKGITERIAIGHTSYYGSPANRVHNVKVGAAKFNGKLIAPDETFSFNKNLGAVDGSTGYKKELVIKQEGTIPEFGGGVCQVSTTFYRAILLSGLQIVERNQHSYAVSYYSQILGHGLDATIYLGGPDFKFKNDTKDHILVQTYVDKDFELYFVLYGTKDGRSVEMEGPYLSNYRNPPGTVYIETSDLPEGQKKQVEKPHTGFNALWYRHVTKANGEVITEEIKTNYKAMPAKILVGTAKAASTPTP